MHQKTIVIEMPFESLNYKHNLFLFSILTDGIILKTAWNFDLKSLCSCMPYCPCKACIDVVTCKIKE